MLSTLHKPEVLSHPKAQGEQGDFLFSQPGIIFYYQIRAGFWKVKSLTVNQENSQEQAAYFL